MKTIKTLFIALFLCISFTSCGDIIDNVLSKFCEADIKDTKEFYNTEIDRVKNDQNLTQNEKEEQIASYEKQRDDEIIDIEENCN